MNNSEKKQDLQPGDPLGYWNKWTHVDDEKCLKKISGGNLNGKTDINPVWRMRKLTEVFGPVGFGWNVTEKERWTNECAGEVGAFVKVELRICIEGKWSEPIEGTGGSKLCGKGKGDGLNDEAWKMATTDAISVACKSLGMAADVYTGRQSHPTDTGPDFGTKYEQRNYARNSTRSPQPGNYTTQAPNGQNRSVSAPAAGTQVARRTVTIADIQRGKASRLITELSQHDYDDPADWNAGLGSLMAQYDYADGALDEIHKLAVQERNTRLASASAQAYRQQINNNAQ